MSASARLDPRTRLGLAVTGAVLIVCSARAEWLLAELALLVGAVLLVGEGAAYLRWLRWVTATALVWFAISLLAFDLSTAVGASLRLAALASVFFLLFRTTAAEELGNALVKAGLPYPVAFVFGASLQFVPVLRRKAQNVIDAQRSRGIPLEPGLAALRPYGPRSGLPILSLLVPLLLQAFQLADELAEAMEARGFGRPGRTFMQEYRMRAVDWIVLVGSIALAAWLIGWVVG